MSERIIFEKSYDWESLYDLSRDVEEAVDPALNKAMKGIPEDFKGAMCVRITYRAKS